MKAKRSLALMGKELIKKNMKDFDKNFLNSSVKCAKNSINHKGDFLKNMHLCFLLVAILLPIFHPGLTFAMDSKMTAEATEEVIREVEGCFSDQKAVGKHSVNSFPECASTNHQSDFSNLNQSIDLPTAYSLQPIASIRPVGRIVTAQESVLRIENQIEALKQISREKRGEKKAYLWNCIITKLEHARNSWNKVCSQGNEERLTRWQQVAEASETAVNGMMQLVQAYFSGNKKVIKKLENKVWNAYYLSDASTCLLKSEEAQEEANQIENGLLSNTDATQQFAVEVEYRLPGGRWIDCKEQPEGRAEWERASQFRKKSSEERDFWRNLSKQYKEAADYGIKASKVKNLYSCSTEAANNCVVSVLTPSSSFCTLSRCAPSTPCSSSASATINTGSKSSQKSKWNASLALTGFFLQLQADYQVKAKESQKAGNIILAEGYTAAAKTSQQAAGQYKISARESLAIREKERKSLHWGGIAYQAVAEYKMKANRAQENGKAALASAYREAARTLEHATDEYEQSVLDYVKIAYELGDTHYIAGKSLCAKAEYLVKAAEANEAGKIALAANYREAAVISQSAEKQYQEAMVFYSEERHEQGHIFAKKGASLQKKADYQVKISEAQEAENMVLTAEDRNIAETGKLFKITPESFASSLKRKFTEIESSDAESSEDDSSDTDSTETDLSNTELNESESFERKLSEEAKLFQEKLSED